MFVKNPHVKLIAKDLEQVVVRCQRVREPDDGDRLDDPGVAEIQGQPGGLVRDPRPEVATFNPLVHHSGDPLIHCEAGSKLVDLVKARVHTGAVGFDH